MSSKEGKTPKKRKVLTLIDKVAIIHEIEGGKTQAQIVKERNLAKSTICEIIKNKNKILKDYSVFGPTVKKTRNCQFPLIDSALIQWHDLQRSRNIPLNGPILLAQAKKYAADLNVESFSGSVGWLERWKRRHSVTFVTIVGEENAVNTEVVDEWLKNVWPVLSEGYSPENIFNTDETALFYKLLPNKTMSRKGASCKGGKLAKDRITVLLTSNATGSEKIKPLVIGKSQNPRCFKNVKKQNLPVNYYANKTAWMRRDIFAEWLKKLDLRMRFQKRKIILTLDNCEPHNVDVKLSNIKLVYFPPNVTAKLQPMDQGIINETKKIYRSILVRKIIDKMDNKEDPAIDILEAILILGSAWSKLKPETIKNCFYHSKIISRPSEVEVSEIENTNTLDDNVVAEIINTFTVDEETAQAYLSVDSEVEPYGFEKEEDILLSLTSSNDEPNNGVNSNDDDDGEDDPEILRNLPTNRQASKMIEDLKLWMLNQELEDQPVLNCIFKLEEFLRKSSLSKLKQTRITDFCSVSTQ